MQPITLDEALIMTGAVVVTLLVFVVAPLLVAHAYYAWKRNKQLRKGK